VWCIRLLYRKDEGESEITSRRRHNQLVKFRNDISSSVISVTDIKPLGMRTEEQEQLPDSKIDINSDIQNESNNTLSLHFSGETLSLDNYDDAATGDDANNNRSTNNHDDNEEILDHTILLDEEHMMGIETNVNKLYVDY
jgi:hypothetical protein